MKNETALKQDLELTKRVHAKFENFKNLEKEHGQLTAIAVEDKIGLFKKPSRQVISMATALQENEPMKFMEVIADNCFVAGDRELLDDDDCFLAIMPMLNQLRELKTAQLVKL
jgi:hypothetical protein